jgi:hypothetical protein
MRDYKVTVSGRVNINSLAREEKTVRVTARNREAAMILAGAKLQREGAAFLAESISVTCEYVRTAW